MEKMIKTFVVILLVLFLTSACMLQVKADYNDEMGKLITKSYSDSSSASNNASNVLTTIIVVVRIIAMAIAIIMLLTIAMKYMIAAPGERADIKKSAIVYVVGAFILMGFTGILTLIQKFAKPLNPPAG